MSDFLFESALQLAAIIRRGDASAVEVLEAFLAQVDRVNPQIGAFVTIDGQHARVEAALIDEKFRQGGSVGPLAGVPVGVKDVVETAGVRTTYSSKGYSSYIPVTDDATWRRMKTAGCVLVGKTNTPEFAGLDHTMSELNGVCRNPWNLELTAGGSSGGSAAAVATSMCAVADGTDGGGSIRTPAACCGVLGLKPSRGLVSLAPRFGEQMAGMVTGGPIARSSGDLALLLDVLGGYEVGDPYWTEKPHEGYLGAIQRPLPKLRIAYTASSPAGFGAVDRDCTRAVSLTASALEANGHELTEATPPWDNDTAWRAVQTLYTSWLAHFNIEDPATLEKHNADELRAARQISMPDYLQATVCLSRWARRLVSFFGSFDLLVTPSTGLPAVPLEWIDDSSEAAILEQMRGFVPTSAVWNVTGQPAVSVPVLWNEQGVPVGVQLIARPAGDSLLLQVCSFLEQVYPWVDRKPPIAMSA